MLNTDRDPIDPSVLAKAVSTLQRASFEAHDLEAAAKGLLDALLDQGCLRPEEHAEAWIEDISSHTIVIEWGDPDHGLGVRADGTTFLYD